MPGAIAGVLAAERRQLPLWLPVALAVGIGAYFALTWEPPVYAAALPMAAGGLLRAAARSIPARALAAGIMAGALGFGLAQLHTHFAWTPSLTKRVGPVMVTGTVADIVPGAASSRLILERPAWQGGRGPPFPARVRITVRRMTAGLAAGQTVRVRARLRPPPAPLIPGGFDFQRRAYFKRIGAYGFAVGAVEIVAAAETKSFRSRAAHALSRARHTIVARIVAAFPGPAGGVAAALLTGHRGHIPEQTMTAMRDAGLAHLLAISGLHIGLAAGTVFAAARGFLLLVPFVGLRIDVKKAAAAIAIAAAAAYAMLAGWTVPTERAFIMTGLVLLGVLLDRKAVSLRTVAWAATVILIGAPESLLSPGFQMSFAAVAALIGAYEWLAAQDWFRRGKERAGVVRRVARYFGAVLLSSVIAGSATAPFAVYHFQHVATLGLVANAVAVPLAALWVMPAGFMALAVFPAGLEAGPLALMVSGIEVIVAVAGWVTDVPWAAADVPSQGLWALLTVVFGGLWLIIWRRRWRILGLPLMLAGCPGPMLVAAPDMLVDGRGRVVAVHLERHGLVASSAVKATFEVGAWRRAYASGSPGHIWPKAGQAQTDGLRCDYAGCVLERGTFRTAISNGPESLNEDCLKSDVVVALAPIRIRCRGPTKTIDRFDLWREGTHALWIRDGRVRVESVNGVRGYRPWVIRPSRRVSRPGRAPSARPGP